VKRYKYTVIYITVTKNVKNITVRGFERGNVFLGGRIKKLPRIAWAVKRSLEFFYLENIEDISIWTGKITDVVAFSTGDSPTITKNIDKRKATMHCHGTELAAIGIKIKGIPDFMSMVAH
jgi:hypothetical protein